jgi:hypothetical protein
LAHRNGAPSSIALSRYCAEAPQPRQCSSRDTKKIDSAAAAINLFCSEQFQEIYAGDGGFPTAIPSVAAKVAAKDKLWAQINQDAVARPMEWARAASAITTIS